MSAKVPLSSSSRPETLGRPVFELIQEKQKIKVNVTIAIGLSLLIVGMAIYMIPSSFNVTNQWLSQIATTVSLLLDVFIWYFVQNKLSGNLINVDRVNHLKRSNRPMTL